ncbi:unnamed protein product [Urochloa humidicola]
MEVTEALHYLFGGGRGAVRRPCVVAEMTPRNSEVVAAAPALTAARPTKSGALVSWPRSATLPSSRGLLHGCRLVALSPQDFRLGPQIAAQASRHGLHHRRPLW